MSRGPRLSQSDVTAVVGMTVADPLLPDTRIAAIVGRSASTVKRVRDKYIGLIEEYRRLKSRDIIDDLDCIRRANLMHVADPAVIHKQSGLQAATTYAILTDKMLLESGRPTSISLSATVDATMPDLLGRLKRALEGRAASTLSSSGTVETTATTSSEEK